MHRGAAATRKLGELPAPKALLPTPDMCPSTQAGTRAHMHVHMHALLTHMSMCAPTHAVHTWVRTLQAHARVQTHAKARAYARGHTCAGLQPRTHTDSHSHTGTRVLMQRTHAHAQETALSGGGGSSWAHRAALTICTARAAPEPSMHPPLRQTRRQHPSRRAGWGVDKVLPHRAWRRRWSCPAPGHSPPLPGVPAAGEGVDLAPISPGFLAPPGGAASVADTCPAASLGHVLPASPPADQGGGEGSVPRPCPPWPVCVSGVMLSPPSLAPGHHAAGFPLSLVVPCSPQPSLWPNSICPWLAFLSCPQMWTSFHMLALEVNNTSHPQHTCHQTSGWWAGHGPEDVLIPEACEWGLCR